MEDFQVSQANIPTSLPSFIIKLWNMVCNPDTDDIISWNTNGNSFVINDQIIFYTSLLPMYYKHNNMTSFIRQLNLYGFHKIPNTRDNHVIEFYHPFFQKGEPDLLTRIKRKPPGLKDQSNLTTNPKDLHKALSEVKLMKQKQDDVDSQLAQLQQENSSMWYELNELRAKHKRQMKIINRLVQFLINFVHLDLKNLHDSSNTDAPSGGATIFEVDGETGASEYWKKIDAEMIEDDSEKFRLKNKMIEMKETDASKSNRQSLSLVNYNNPLAVLDEICNMTKSDTSYPSGESRPKRLKLASPCLNQDTICCPASDSDDALEILESLGECVESHNSKCPAIDSDCKKVQKVYGLNSRYVNNLTRKPNNALINNVRKTNVRQKMSEENSQLLSKSAEKITINEIPNTSALALNNIAGASSVEVASKTGNLECTKRIICGKINKKVADEPVDSDSLNDISSSLDIPENNLVTLKENQEKHSVLQTKDNVAITGEKLNSHVETMENDLNNLKEFLNSYDIDTDNILEMFTSELYNEDRCTVNDAIKKELIHPGK